MIQRIQTIYLSGAVIFCALMFFFPFGEIQSPQNTYVLDAYGLHHHDNGTLTEMLTIFQKLIITALVTAVAIVALVSVFMFRKRSLQIILCKLNILLLAGLIFAVFYCLDKGSSMITAFVPVAEVSYNAGIAFPIVSIVLTFLASRAIKKDEELVRAADRIR